MSTCISSHGEYSDHEAGDWCPRCGAFNESAIVAERDALRDEVERLRRGGKTLGEILAKQLRALLDITGRHDLVDENGDGDWGAVWDSLYEMRAECDGLREKVQRLESGDSEPGGSR